MNMKWKETNKIATMKYITVLDFEVARIFQYKISKLDLEVPHPHEVCEDFLIEKGHNLGNIEWMEHDIKEFVDHTIKSIK